jgi:toxin ParE1/3/4
MSRLLRLLPEARAEFDASADWYERQKPGLGVAFVGRVRDVLNRISANPQLHAVVYQNVRKAVVQRFPFVVLYQEDGGEVLVISVFHTSRNPSVWKSRVP